MNDPLTSKLLGRSRQLVINSSASIYVTGCSGWFGRCTLEALWAELGASVFKRRVRPYTSAGGSVRLRDGTAIATLRFDSLPTHRDDGCVMLHYAYLTKERTHTMSIPEYLQANRDITKTVLAALGPLGCKSIFLPSSGAVYRPDVVHDDVSTSNAYGKLKLEDEGAFSHWAESAPGRSAAICRVFNVSGPYINKYSDYALSSIIDAALRGQPVQIRTAKRTFRSFVAIEEVVSLALCLLYEPPATVTVFDTAGEAAVEINELVAEVDQALQCQVSLSRPHIIEEEDRYLGTRSPYAALLDRFDIIPVAMRDQIMQTARYIQQFPGC